MFVDKNGKPLYGAAKLAHEMKEVRTATMAQLSMVAVELSPLLGGEIPNLSVVRSVLQVMGRSDVCLRYLKAKADHLEAGFAGEQQVDALAEVVATKCGRQKRTKKVLA
ncbi:MAG: hypothetical protein ACTHOL_18095 [Luteibacter jiangsuensis]